ncbi:hypothetical protein ACOMHN_005542 [Nucella lapillus]
MEGVQLKRNGPRDQPAQSVRGREALAGNQHITPYPAPVFFAENEDPVMKIQGRGPGKQMSVEGPGEGEKGSEVSAASFVTMVTEEDSTMVVDMGAGAGAPQSMHSLVSSVQIPAALKESDCNIKWRQKVTLINDPTDFPEVTEKQGGHIINGTGRDVCQLLTEEPAWADKGVILNSQVLCADSGGYSEGEHYSVYPGSRLKGGFGEAVMCQDHKTGKTFMCKMSYARILKNEVMVPLQFQGRLGIPEVYGVIQRPHSTLVFQEYAGMSLDRLCNSQYAARLREPSIQLGLAFQGFKTVEELHSKGIKHLDIKPQNICVDMGQKVPCLKLIDFGSSQMPGEVTTQGLTYEYLSPESCSFIIMKARAQAQQGEGVQIPAASATLEGGLESGADVWAFTLSLMYCLCGYHLMVFACTGRTVYPEASPQVTAQRRAHCLLEISQKTDEAMGRLISPLWAAVLRTLFTHTLRVNPHHRWSARQAATFILANLLEAQKGSQSPESPRDTDTVTDTLGVRLRARPAQVRQGQLCGCTPVRGDRVDLTGSENPADISEMKVLGFDLTGSENPADISEMKVLGFDLTGSENPADISEMKVLGFDLTGSENPADISEMKVLGFDLTGSENPADISEMKVLGFDLTGSENPADISEMKVLGFDLTGSENPADISEMKVLGFDLTGSENPADISEMKVLGFDLTGSENPADISEMKVLGFDLTGSENPADISEMKVLGFDLTGSENPVDISEMKVLGFDLTGSENPADISEMKVLGFDLTGSENPADISEMKVLGFDLTGSENPADISEMKVLGFDLTGSENPADISQLAAQGDPSPQSSGQPGKRKRPEATPTQGFKGQELGEAALAANTTTTTTTITTITTTSRFDRAKSWEKLP